MIDPDVLGDAFRNFGYSLATALNNAADVINKLVKSLSYAGTPEWKSKLKLLHNAEMDLKARYKSNNWRKMHGYPLRKKVRHK